MDINRLEKFSFTVSAICANSYAALDQKKFKILADIRVEVLKRNKNTIKLLVESIWSNPMIDTIYDSIEMTVSNKIKKEKDLFVKLFQIDNYKERNYPETYMYVYLRNFPKVNSSWEEQDLWLRLEWGTIVINRLLNTYVEYNIKEDNKTQGATKSNIHTSYLNYKYNNDLLEKRMMFDQKEEDKNRETTIHAAMIVANAIDHISQPSRTI